MLKLYGGIFLATWLAELEKEIHYELQKSSYALQSRAATCDGFTTIHAIVEERKPNSTLHAQKCWETSCKENLSV